MSTPFGTGFSPLLGEPRVGCVPIPNYGYSSATGAVVTDSTAGAITYTIAQLLSGFILRDPNGSARTDVLPTAELLIAGIPGVAVGCGFEFTIRNTADASETITMSAGTGGTTSGTMTIAQNNSKRFLIVVTNATKGSGAYYVYSLGTVTT